MINDGNDALRAKENCFRYSFQIHYVQHEWNNEDVFEVFSFTYFFMLEDLSCVILYSYYCGCCENFWGFIKFSFGAEIVFEEFFVLAGIEMFLKNSLKVLGMTVYKSSVL